MKILKLKPSKKYRQQKVSEKKYKDKISRLHILAKIGQLSSGIFHDLINPLTAIALNLHQAKEYSQQSSDQVKKHLEQALSASKHMENLLLSVRKQIDDQKQNFSFNLKNKVEEIIDIINYQAQKHQINLYLKIDPKININGSEIKFGRVLLNLIINALDACTETKNNPKAVQIRGQKKENFITVQIIDNGCGVPQKIKKQIFNPFFSTKKNKQDRIGLGLSLSREIIEKSFNGKVEIINNPGETIFEIKIPAEEKSL